MKFSTYIISCGLLALELCADTNTWQSATSPGDWTNTGNWSSQTLPTSSTTAIFPDISGNYTVNVDTAAQTAGTLQFSGSSTKTISGNALNLYSGITVLGPAAPLISSNIVMMSSSSFAVNLSGANLTINGVITGSNGMTISGGSLFLGGANTYSGTTEVQNGANLSASANNCFSPNSTVLLDDGASMNCNTFANLTVATVTTPVILSTDTNPPVLNLNTTTLTLSAPSGVFYGQITDNGTSPPGGLTLSGDGTFTIATPDSTWNDYYGPTTISTVSGTATLKVGAPNALSQNSALAIGTNGLLDISEPQATQVTIANLGGTGNANVNLGANELVFGSDNNLSSFAGTITTGGSGWTFHKVGTNNFTLTGTISSTNAGTIEIDSGQFIVSGLNRLGSKSSIAMSGTSILDVSAASSSNSIANLSGASGNQVKIGSNTLTINDTAANTFAGTIYGGTNSIFAKTGSTTLTLSNAGAFTNFQGGLSLTGGNLLLQQTTALTIQSLNGSGSGTLTLDNSNLIVTLGGSSNVGTFSGGITGSGGLTLPTGTTFTMTGSNTYLGSTTLQGDAVLNASGSNNNSTIVMDSTTEINLQGNYSVGAINDPQGFGQIAGTVHLNGYNLSIKAPAGTFSGAIPLDGGSVTVTNAGTWTIASAEHVNAYTGTTSITNNAILSVTNSNALSKASPISLGTSGELSLAADVEVGGLTSTDSTGIIQLGENKLTVNLNSTLSTFEGQITSNDSNLPLTNGLTLKGAGTLTLSGTSNNYTGTTRLNTGAILTGNAGSLSPKSIINLSDTSQLNVNGTNKINDLTDDGSGDSKITLAAGTLTIQGNANTGPSGTYTGQITGQGNLIVTNYGTLILNNTLGSATNYQGTTTISNYANITANSSKSLSPNSSVILTTGLLTLDPPLSSDAITIKDLTADGTSQVNIIKGTLILGGSSQSTSCSAYIYGGGGITKQNTSTFTLITLPDNPKNEYSGPTTITGGTLAAGSDSAFSEQSIITLTQGILDANVYKSAIPDLNGSSGTTITIASGGVLTIGVVPQASPSGTYFGQIKGNGGFGLDNLATYTLNPNSLKPNSYYGVTNITGNSKLSAGQQNSFSPNSVVNIDSGSTLDVAGYTNTIGGLKGSGIVDLGPGPGNTLSIGGINPPSPFSGQITGDMGIKKIGAGSLTLSGTSNNYTGPTEVNGGSLVINGKITSTTTVTVDAGGTLKGTGEITGDVLCSGTTAPGNSIGTLSLIGDYTALPGSNFQVETNATIADKLNVTGTFTINTNATLTVLPYKGLYTPGTPYVIVETTGGVNGAFHSVVTTLTKAQVDVDYTNLNKVILYLTIKAFSDIGLSWNAINVAGALDRIMSIDPPEWSEELDTLFYLSESDLNIALNQLDPAQLKGFSIIQQNNAVRVQNGISLRFQNFLDKMKCPRLRGCNFKKSPVYFWVDGFNGKLRQPSNLVDTNPQVGYRANTGGGSMGIDMNFLKHGFVGLMGAGTYSDVKWVKGQGSGHITSAYAGIYASWLKEKQFANFSLLGATSSYSAHRNIIYPGVYETAKSEHNGLQLLTHLDLGLNFQAFGITVRPFESLDFIIQHENAFQESNAHVYNLDVQKTNPQMFRNELGLTFAKCFNAWKKSRILADLKLSWVSESRMKGTLFTSNFINFDEITFQTKGYYPNRNFFSPGASLTGNFFKDTAYITVSYDAEIGNHYLDQRTGLQIGIKF